MKIPSISLELDQNFVPAILYLDEYKKAVLKTKSHDKLTIVIERNDNLKESYETIGSYLGFSLAYYSEFYDTENVLLLGRVMSGEGGIIITNRANETLKKYFPKLAKKITLHLPDEKTRRVGQSIAAASLVKLGE